jgi:(S)-ureidoglycine aminohydrolase
VHHLGDTRSARRHDHLLHTPETFVRAPLPGMRNATAIVHISAALGAGFVQYTVEFDAGGELAPARDQRFVYVLEGEVLVDGCADALAAGGFVYMPAASGGVLRSAAKARAVVIEKPYESRPGCGAPTMVVGREPDAPPSPLNGDPDLEVRALIPDDPSFDFRVNTMRYQPGATLPAVEIHVMEHGLVMLEGGGIYRLNDRWYPVAAGDVIWMAAYCPQWFGALGNTPAKYLIYKDWDRLPR